MYHHHTDQTYFSRLLVFVKSFNESRGPLDSLGRWGEGLSDDRDLVWVDHLLPRVAHTSTLLRYTLQPFKI